MNETMFIWHLHFERLDVLMGRAGHYMGPGIHGDSTVGQSPHSLSIPIWNLKSRLLSFHNGLSQFTTISSLSGTWSGRVNRTSEKSAEFCSPSWSFLRKDTIVSTLLRNWLVSVPLQIILLSSKNSLQCYKDKSVSITQMHNRLQITWCDRDVYLLKAYNC